MPHKTSKTGTIETVLAVLPVLLVPWFSETDLWSRSTKVGTRLEETKIDKLQALKYVFLGQLVNRTLEFLTSIKIALNQFLKLKSAVLFLLS
jgi:hypothetical protein